MNSSKLWTQEHNQQLKLVDIWVYTFRHDKYVNHFISNFYRQFFDFILNCVVESNGLGLLRFGVICIKKWIIGNSRES